MCIGALGGNKLPPTPPNPKTMVDPEVQKARSDAQTMTADSGLAATTLNVNLGGTGQGQKKLAGAGR